MEAISEVSQRQAPDGHPFIVLSAESRGNGTFGGPSPAGEYLENMLANQGRQLGKLATEILTLSPNSRFFPTEMDPAPPPSPYTLPQRGKSVFLDVDFADILVEEFGLAARVRKTLSTANDISDSSPDSASDSDADEYKPPVKIWSSSSTNSPYTLRPRPSRTPLLDITPVPTVFTRAHLESLNFRCIKWDE